MGHLKKKFRHKKERKKNATATGPSISPAGTEHAVPGEKANTGKIPAMFYRCSLHRYHCQGSIFWCKNQCLGIRSDLDRIWSVFIGRIQARSGSILENVSAI
jgi:hypothetical protein